MTEKQREEVALFRFGVISELVCSRLESGEMAARIREKSEQRWHIPYSCRTRIAESTIRRWVSLYLNNNRQLASLYPQKRSDQGRSRRVDEETILSLVKLRKEMPGLPVARLLAEMEKRELMPPWMSISLTTAYRILKQEGPSVPDILNGFVLPLALPWYTPRPIRCRAGGKSSVFSAPFVHSSCPVFPAVPCMVSMWLWISG